MRFMFVLALNGECIGHTCRRPLVLCMCVFEVVATHSEPRVFKLERVEHLGEI